MRKLSILLAVAMLAAIVLGVSAGNISIYQQNKDAAHQAAELMRSYGYGEDNPVIRAASDWWWENHNAELKSVSENQVPTAAIIDAPTTESNLKESDAPIKAVDPQTYYTIEQYDQYPVACTCYAYLRDEMGLSHAVASGIIGGWMEECGGQTLALDPNLWVGSGYYAYGGIAMWSLYYCPEVYLMTLDEQLDYFASTLQSNIEAFGGNYNYFCSLTEPSDVVWYYYTYYGRGYGSPSWQRILNGQTAYDYFS